jgi:predicted O-methyltransferase YrrM
MIEQIEQYAKENKVPIMLPDGIEYLCNYIKDNNIKNILEIGTAIGYSAIKMATCKEKIHVTTIERDEQRYLEAIKNIKKLDLEEKIMPIFNDALNVSLDDKYDLIFIDASKSQNIKFFEKFSRNLEEDGTIITDNMSFHGLVEKDESEIKTRNLRGLIRKVKDYKEFLETNKTYTTEFIDVGDGLAVSKRKEK